mmetsp:Transcript_4253/g.5862  ORF Transcript_4253/g.5862 Transcript_4253/m.5862 type:complete len:97 (-) Transcript_4253:742-1032(-)
MILGCPSKKKKNTGSTRTKKIPEFLRASIQAQGFCYDTVHVEHTAVAVPTANQISLLSNCCLISMRRKFRFRKSAGKRSLKASIALRFATGMPAFH